MNNVNISILVHVTGMSLPHLKFYWKFSILLLILFIERARKHALLTKYISVHHNPMVHIHGVSKVRFTISTGTVIKQLILAFSWTHHVMMHLGLRLQGFLSTVPWLTLTLLLSSPNFLPMTGDCCVSKFLRRSLGGKNLICFQSENTVLDFFRRSVDGASASSSSLKTKAFSSTP